MSELLLEVLRSLIYHGRHFSKTRDEVVLRKSLDRIIELTSNPSNPWVKASERLEIEDGQYLTRHVSGRILMNECKSGHFIQCPMTLSVAEDGKSCRHYIDEMTHHFKVPPLPEGG